MQKDQELEQRAQSIVDLLNGHPGPFFEDDNHFFGRKRVDPSMKDRKMETDCGGGIVTKAPITYGEANDIISKLNAKDVCTYIKNIKSDFAPAYWHITNNSVFRGDLYWAIYSYLATNKLIKGSPKGYNNSMEGYV